MQALLGPAIAGRQIPLVQVTDESKPIKIKIDSK
jgi:hypothetical protein